MGISVTVNEGSSKVTVSGSGARGVSATQGATTVTVSTPTTRSSSLANTQDRSSRQVSVNNTAIASASSAASMAVTPVGSLTSTTLQGALEELANNDFRSTSAPSGAQVQEGDTWYDTDDNQYKIYRETSSGVFQWVPIMVGSVDGDSDTLDAGAF